MQMNLPNTTTADPAVISLPVPDPHVDRVRKQCREEGRQALRDNQHENPYPTGSIAARAWQEGHREIACDDCSGRRVQLACPECESQNVRSWEFVALADPGTGYDDTHMRATCEDCQHSAPEEDFNVPCLICGGTGIEPERNYLGEAIRIVQEQDESITIERGHLVAVFEHARKLATAALMMPEIKEVA